MHILNSSIVNRLLKFGSVGILGVVTNLTIYTTLIFLDLNYNLASSLAFVVAVSQNFMLNKRWTFKDHDREIKNMFIKY